MPNQRKAGKKAMSLWVDEKFIVHLDKAAKVRGLTRSALIERLRKRLNDGTQPRRTNDVSRESGTKTPNRRRLQ